MNIMVVSIITAALGTVPETLELILDRLKIRRRNEIVQTMSLLMTAGLWRKVGGIWVYLLSLNLLHQQSDICWKYLNVLTTTTTTASSSSTDV